MFILIAIQLPGQGWHKSTGSLTASDVALSVIQTSDGGYISAGYTAGYGAGGTDILVVKTDPSGNLQWQQVIGGAGNDTGTCIVQHPSGDYFISGTTNSSGAGQLDVYLIKLDNTGNMIWTNTYGGAQNDFGKSLLLTSSGDLVIAGFTNSSGAGGYDAYLVKVDASGTVQWTKTIGKTGNELIHSIAQVHDGGFLLTGNTNSYGTGNIGFAVRTNSAGDTTWTRAYNIGNKQGTSLYAGAEVSGDTAFVFTGYGGTQLYGDLVALRTSLNGIASSTTYGPFLAAGGYNITPTSDGGFVAVGYYSNYGSRTLLAKYSSANVKQWEKSYLNGAGYTYMYFGGGYSVIKTNDGGFIIAGNTTLKSGNSDFLLIKTDSAGNANDPVINNASAGGPVSFCSGGSVTLSVPAGFDTYQWVRYDAGSSYWINGATGTNYTATSGEGYYCVMTNDSGIWRSNGINVTVNTNVTASITPAGTINTCLASNVVTLTANSISGATYQWNLNGTPISGATSTTYSPTGSGSYTVTVTNPCGNSTSAATTVNGSTPPTVYINVNGPASLIYNTNYGNFCSTPLFSATSQSGVTFTWYWNGSVIGGNTSSQSAYGTGNYYVTATNSCGTSTSQTINIGLINVTTNTGAAGPTSGCGVNSVTLYPDPQFTVIQWYHNNVAIPGATGSTYDATISGSYDCDVQDFCNGIPIIYRTTPITVTIGTTPSPTISATGNTTVCSGSVALSASVSGATYQWKKDNVNISGATSQTYAATATGSYTCLITNAACGTANSNAIFVKIGNPSGTISGNTAICSGASSTLSLSTSDGASITTRQWRLNGSSIPGATGTTYSASAAGVYDLVLTNACGTATTNAITITVNPNPTASVTPSGTAYYCPGGSVTLTAATGGGYTYQWYKNNAAVSGATSSVYSASTAGNYHCRVTLSGCYVNSNTIAVVQSAVPVSNIWNSTPLKFCNGGSVQLNANTGTGYSYQWFKDGVANGAVNNNYNAFVSGNYHVIIANALGCTTASPAVSVVAHPVPTVTFTGLASSYLVTAPAATLTGSPTGGTFSGPGITGNTFSPALAGTGGPYTIIYTYTGTNGCTGTDAQQTTVTNCTLPAMPGSIVAAGGNTKVCPGDTKTYSITAVAGATSYTWTPPPGGVIASGQGTVSVTINYTSGFVATDTLRVHTNNGCGSSADRILKITRNTPALPGAITTTGGNVKVCPGETRTYTIAAVANATSYTWTPPAGSIILSGQGSVSVTVSYTAAFTASDTLRVHSNNACGSSADRVLKITRNNPGTPSAITGDTYGLCNLAAVPYAVTNVSGMMYNWSFNVAPATIATGQGTNGITADFGPGFVSATLSVTASNGCGTSPVRLKTLYAKPPTPTSITGATSVCVNQQDVPYSTPVIANVTSYTWLGPAGSHISDGITTSAGNSLVTTATSVTVDFGTTAGYVRVRATNACGTGSYKSLAVTTTCRTGEIQENELPLFDFAVIPNPNGGAFALQFTDVPLEDAVITISDLLGKTVARFEAGTDMYQALHPELSQGIYYITFLDRTRSVSRKMVVEK